MANVAVPTGDESSVNPRKNATETVLVSVLWLVTVTTVAERMAPLAVWEFM
jgi:hypothetical protein